MNCFWGDWFFLHALPLENKWNKSFHYLQKYLKNKFTLFLLRSKNESKIEYFIENLNRKRNCCQVFWKILSGLFFLIFFDLFKRFFEIFPLIILANFPIFFPRLMEFWFLLVEKIGFDWREHCVSIRLWRDILIRSSVEHWALSKLWIM